MKTLGKIKPKEEGQKEEGRASYVLRQDNSQFFVVFSTDFFFVINMESRKKKM
jgi:hypothetical protein